MTLPRTDYPKRGLPAPPGLHVEFVPGVGEANREFEALINPTDGGTDARVVLAAGATPGISVDLARLLAAIQSRGTDTADAVRAVRSGVDSLLYELQHPKQVLYESPIAGVTVDVNGLNITPWIDIRLHRWFGWYLANIGQNALTSTIVLLSEDPAGAAPFNNAEGAAAAVGAGGCFFSQYFIPINSGWNPSTSTPLTANYIRFFAASAAGTTVRVKLVGMR